MSEYVLNLTLSEMKSPVKASTALQQHVESCHAPNTKNDFVSFMIQNFIGVCNITVAGEKKERD